MRLIFTALFALGASPALAATGAFVSLKNTNFVVLIAFLIFVGILLYMKVPSAIGAMLDKRAEAIRSDLNEAKSLREEAQSLLAAYERKQKEVQVQADRIVAAAKEEATNAATAAKADIAASITRRLAAAEEQIASAQSAAVKAVRDEAITVAIGAAKDVITQQMDAKSAGTLIDDAITTVSEKMH